MSLRDRVLIHIYRACLLTYPREFRAAYGPEMVQVFRSALRDSSAPFALVAGAFADLAASAIRERSTSARWDIRYLLVWMSAALLSFAGGYVHIRNDADAVTGMLVLGGAFLCGFVYPQKAFQWGMIVGIGVPLALLAGHGAAPIHPVRDADSFSPAALIPGLFGSYAGAILARVMWFPGDIPPRRDEAAASRR